MKIPRIIEAMSYIDDDLVTETEEWIPQRKPERRANRFLIPALATAVIAVAVLAIVVSGLRRGTDHFTIVAYAATPDHVGVTGSDLRTGEKIPIDALRTRDGENAFVFAKPDDDFDGMPSITVLSGGNATVSYDEIAEITQDASRDYYVYIPQEAVAPYKMPFTVIDKTDRRAKIYEVTISQEQDGYFATMALQSTEAF